MLNQFKSSLNHAMDGFADWKSLYADWCEGRFPIRAAGARGPWAAALIARLAPLRGASVLVVVPDEAEARSMVRDLEFFIPEVSHFPWWGTMLYRGVSPQASVFGRRAGVLAELASGERRVVVASLRAALGCVPSPESAAVSLLRLERGGEIDPVEIEQRLIEYGFSRVPRVSVPGEFTLRGEVLDIHPLGEDMAVRVVFGWDTVEEIRFFDPLTQSSAGGTDHLVLHPLKEILWDDDKVEHLRRSLPEKAAAEILESLETRRSFRGEELFYPMAAAASSKASSKASKHTIADFLGSRGVTVYVDDERLESAAESMEKEFGELYRRAVDEGLTVPPPDELTVPLSRLRESRKSSLSFRSLPRDDEPAPYRLPCDPPRSFFGNIGYMKDEFTALMEAGYRIFVFAESESQAGRIEYLLRDIPGIVTAPASLSAGFALNSPPGPRSPQGEKIIVVQESEIFGRRRKAPDSVSRAQSAAIETFVDLNPGDLIVHINHGIGRFKGIRRIKAAGAERDYIEILYRGEETVFVPIEQVNLVQRYIGREGTSPRLDRIGGPSWEKKKARVKKSAADLADHLVKLYARRQSAAGFAFPKDDDFQVSFEAAFPWQETDDQLTAVADVKSDMERPKPMDRLICGDVGYGKTEIAMRAAFKAVMGGRQVACLCPTTILAEQHHENFTERFKRFPVTVGMLSRFVPAAERATVIGGLKTGDIDIVIGTHRILSKDVSFRNLGLIIIDEEQRFGVKDKERLKELKSSVDCLTLSATPIPRTLHMSLLKIRDMSLLKTPPSNRRPIETFIQPFSDDVIAAAVRREAERGGQVFYLHNRVDTLEAVQLHLQRLIPEVFVESAHGRMSPRQLEDVMHRFIRGAFQVLVSTTIIENGIDIPNVNTIIIDRADIYGISQLYQLRGRVGRSTRLAYAYLLYPEDRQLSEIAVKRLGVISDFTELGSGFKIAMKDLEVRGAGNLLGPQQSGDVYAVGFDLYLRLLDAAIRERTEGADSDEAPETYLELDYSGFIPETYISDDSEKMEVYKKIAAVGDEERLQQLHAELHDRYGPLPDEVHSLISMAEIRIICRKLKVSSLKERGGRVQVTFGKVSLISAERVMNLVTSTAGRVKLDPARPDALLMETGEVGLKEKSEFIKERLGALL